jgi:heme-degrading monooxygenase HmoA
VIYPLSHTHTMAGRGRMGKRRIKKITARTVKTGPGMRRLTHTSRPEVIAQRNETQPKVMTRFTSSQAVIPWRKQRRAIEEKIRRTGHGVQLPERFSDQRQARNSNARYINDVYATDTLRFGVGPHHVYPQLRRRDIVKQKSAAATRIY